MFISLQEPKYLTALADYITALRSRNAALRSTERDSRVFQAYEPILAENGLIIVDFRQRYLQMIEKQVLELLREHGDEEKNFNTASTEWH